MVIYYQLVSTVTIYISSFVENFANGTTYKKLFYNQFDKANLDLKN